MTVEGHIENGQIVLDGQIPLMEGMKVRVELLEYHSPKETTRDESTEKLPSLYERMKPFVGCVKDLPSDYALNHDHYLHGQPKRQ